MSAKNEKRPEDANSIAQREAKRTRDALTHRLAEPQPTNYNSVPAGEEADGGESVLGGAPREGEAEHVERAANHEHPSKPNDR